MYYINEEMLGKGATKQDAEILISCLSKKGYEVKYGFGKNKSSPFRPADWEDCLFNLSLEKMKDM